MAELSASERAAIASDALDTAEALDGIGNVRDLSGMTLDEIVDYMQSLGVDLDLETIEAEARSALGTDARLIDRGVALDPEKRADLETRLKRAIERNARYAARQTVRQARADAFAEGDDREPEDRYLMWVSVGDDGVCDSCGDRHGYVLTEFEWEGSAPGDGDTICRQGCRCTLVPVDAPDRSVTRRNVGRG